MTRINLNIFDATHFRASILAIMIGLPSPITAHDFNFSVGNDHQRKALRRCSARI